MCIGIMARSEDRERKRRLNGMMRDLQMVDPKEILPYLTNCAGNVLTEQTRARCKTDGPMIAAAELMEQLQKREGWYPKLVEALREIGKDKLADELEGPELRSSPSVPSQNVASGSSIQSAQMNPIQARQQQHSPSLPGAEKEVKNSEVDENPGQPPLGASLPTPVQEMRQRTPVSDPQARETGGSAASSPSHDLQVRHDQSESDECNTSPPPEGRSAQTKRGASGEAEGLGSSPPAMDAGAVGVRVPHPKDDELTGRERRKGEEEWMNIPSESEQVKHIHIPKPSNHPNNHGKQNNLSPTIGSRETNRNSDQTNYIWARNEAGSIGEEERLSTGTHSLSSSDVDPKYARAINSMSESEIIEGISTGNTASQSGSCLQQNEGYTESTGEVQGGGENRSGTGEMGAIGGVETVDASNDNQDSLLRRVGTSVVRGVRGYIPTVCNAVSEHILKP